MRHFHSNYHREFGVKRVKRKGEAVVAYNVFKRPCPFQVGEDDLWLPSSTAPPSASKCWGLFLPLTVSSLCFVCWFWCLLSRRVIGNKDLPIYKGITRSLSQEPSPCWDWVLPVNFVLCSLVCPQTHKKKTSLDMETNVPNNAFPRIFFSFLF